MSYIIYYKKKKIHKDYPWNEVKPSAKEALKFIKKLGKAYDVMVFEPSSINSLEEYAEVE